MKTVSVGVHALAAAAMALTVQASALAAGNSITLLATASGDVSYGWNSKYGPAGYTQGGTELGVGLYMGAPYGNDYTVGIIELPIGILAGGDLLGAALQVQTVGFGTGYYYGSAGLTWLNPGASVVTGDPVIDGLGALVGGSSSQWKLWDSGSMSGAPAVMTFDVTTSVQADLEAGRTFSTFVLSGSRDTYGGIYAAESGKGARLTAITTAPVPEPATWLSLLVGLGVLGAVAVRRRQP